MKAEHWSIERYRAEVAKAKPNKFGAKRTEVDGIGFASKREAERYKELKLAKAAGAIRNLRRQVKYELVVNGVKLESYVADFVYDEADEDDIIEDCKGHRTRLYNMKKSLILALYGREIRET